MINLGEVRPGTTIIVPFHTFDSNDPSASVTITGLATTDIEIYKDGGTTQRASDSGYTLLDTDGIDFDSTTGVHGVSIDLSDNTTAGFFAAGAQYMVVIASITVDAATVNFIPVVFTVGYKDALINTTIATLASQTSFTLTNGPAENDALNGLYCVIHDVASAVQIGHATISDYVGSTKTVTLAAGTTFTAAATDNISIMGMAPLQPTTTGATLDVTATGAAGIDWGNIENKTTTNDLSGTDIQFCDTITTYTGNTVQTGDNFARLGAPAGASVSADVAAVKVDTAAILVDTGTTLDGKLDTIDTNVDSILVDTAEIGTAGAGLSDITINAASVDAIWDEDIVAAHTTADTAGLILANTANLAVGAGGISVVAESATVTTGTETLTYTSTQELDGTTHDIADDAGNTEFYYQFDVGVTGVATELIWEGHAESNGDSYTVKAYDWVSSSFKTIGTITANNATTIISQTFIVTSAMTGTAANAGKVRWQITSADGTNFSTDRILCEYTALPEAGVILHSGVAQSATSNTIVLDTGANATDDFYNHARIVISSGTGSEQERMIVDYVGSTKTCTIAPPWVTNPDSTSAFEVEPGLAHAETGWATIKVGMAAAATSTTITLDSAASATNDFYNNDLIKIDAGTGEGQVRVITDYVGATKVATVDPAWTTTPDTTSEYIVEDGHPYTDSSASGIKTDTAAILVDTADMQPKLGTPAADVSADIAAVKVDTAAILVDTGTTLNDKIDTIDTNVDSVLVDTAEIGTAGAGLTDLGGMSTAMKAEVNAEVVDVIDTDTSAELGAVPAATSSLRDRVAWLFAMARNKLTQTSGVTTIRNDADSGDIASSTVSDNGTTATRGGIFLMAVDTAEKRFSILGIGNHTIKHPIPSGSVGKPMRATLMDLYSGITLNDPGGATTNIYFHLLNMGAY